MRIGIEKLIGELKQKLRGDKYWTSKLNELGFSRLHLAIFTEPYFSYILEGKKTIESRFSKNRIAPFDQVEKGDILLLKPSGKGISAVCQVDKVWFYVIGPETLDDIRSNHSSGICPADKSFWTDRAAATYCSLIWISHIKPIESLPIEKRDRRGWVVLK